MTINDIRNEGFTVMNTISLVTDVASVILPIVPAGVSHALRAAKIANKLANTADMAADTIKVVDKVKDSTKALDKLRDYAKYAGDICSFSADTQVTTQEGSESISAIEVGDHVLAWNEADGTLGYYEVTATLSHADEVLTELIINGEWIETTPEHPFYTEEAGWLPADELEPGMHVRQADGDYELVWLKWNVYKTREMYNLTVDTAHTFFVGESQWLVHNSCGKPRNSKYAENVFHPSDPTLSAKYPDGVRFDKSGFPDFSPYSIKDVNIKMKGNYTSDFTQADKLLGRPRPDGYTWHHHQNLKTMQLVPSDLHAAVGHTGGAAILRVLRRLIE